LEQANDVVTGGSNLAMTAVRATAAVRQPVTTTRLGFAVLWHRPREIVSGNSPVAIVPQTVPPSDMHSYLEHAHRTVS